MKLFIREDLLASAVVAVLGVLIGDAEGTSLNVFWAEPKANVVSAPIGACNIWRFVLAFLRLSQKRQKLVNDRPGLFD